MCPGCDNPCVTVHGKTALHSGSIVDPDYCKSNISSRQSCICRGSYWNSMRFSETLFSVGLSSYFSQEHLTWACEIFLPKRVVSVGTLREYLLIEGPGHGRSKPCCHSSVWAVCKPESTPHSSCGFGCVNLAFNCSRAGSGKLEFGAAHVTKTCSSSIVFRRSLTVSRISISLTACSCFKAHAFESFELQFLLLCPHAVWCCV